MRKAPAAKMMDGDEEDDDEASESDSSEDSEEETAHAAALQHLDAVLPSKTERKKLIHWLSMKRKPSGTGTGHTHPFQGMEG